MNSIGARKVHWHLTFGRSRFGYPGAVMLPARSVIRPPQPISLTRSSIENPHFRSRQYIGLGRWKWRGHSFRFQTIRSIRVAQYYFIILVRMSINIKFGLLWVVALLSGEGNSYTIKPLTEVRGLLSLGLSSREVSIRGFTIRLGSMNYEFFFDNLHP